MACVLVFFLKRRNQNELTNESVISVDSSYESSSQSNYLTGCHTTCPSALANLFRLPKKLATSAELHLRRVLPRRSGMWRGLSGSHVVGLRVGVKATRGAKLETEEELLLLSRESVSAESETI